MNDLSPVIWKGRQWAVTEYGMETIGEPYHYYLADRPQLVERRETHNGRVFDAPLHMMENNWLDVDDFVTAWLVAVAVHGLGESDPTEVLETLIQAMRVRAALYGPRPGAIPRPPEATVLSMSDIERYQSEPVWHGSEVLGVIVGGKAQP